MKKELAPDALTAYQQLTRGVVRELTPGVQVHPLWYKDYRREAEHCDIYLHTPTSYGGRAIARHTGGFGYNFCHVEAGVWWSDVDRLMSCGYQEGKGGVARPLSELVRQKQGHIHVYRVNAVDFQQAGYATGVKVQEAGGLHVDVYHRVRKCVSEHLAGDLGQAYGWSNIAIHLLSLLPVARFLLSQRWMAKLVLKASQSSGYGICSQHVARSFGECGLKLIDKPYAVVTPNDIAQSALTVYQGTLIAPRKKE